MRRSEKRNIPILDYFRKVIFSNIFWSCSVILLGLLPLILENVIIGLLMASIPVCIILLARRAAIPRSEWFIISLIVLIFCSFFLLLSEAFIYPIVVYGIGFIVACFSFKKDDFTKDKIASKERLNQYDSIIYGELISSVSQNRNDVSMRFYHDEQYLGTAVPVAKFGYHFTFYGTGVKCSNLYISKKEWKFPFIYPLMTYKLDEVNSNLLTIRAISLWKIHVELYDGDSLAIPLYRRKMELLSKYGMKIKLGLYAEGVIIEYNHPVGKQMDTSIACLIYFLWLIVFGTHRTDY